jgi:hypothetical protein
VLCCCSGGNYSVHGKPCASSPTGQTSSDHDGISCDTCTSGALVAFTSTGVLQFSASS